MTNNYQLNKDFEAWIDRYPNKNGKEYARKIWLEKQPDLDVLMDALDWQLESYRFKMGFIKRPGNYLEQESWNDRPETYAEFKNSKPKQQYSKLIYENRARMTSLVEKIEECAEGTLFDDFVKTLTHEEAEEFTTNFHKYEKLWL